MTEQKYIGRVLVADDIESMRNLCKAYLSRGGYEALVVSDGDEAFKIYQDRLTQKNNQIDLIVSDVVMERISGNQLHENVRQLEKSLGFPNAPFLFVSAHTGDSDRAMDEILRLDPLSFCLHKPFLKDAFLAKVSEAIAYASQTRAST